jgi:hypothetical protein
VFFDYFEKHLDEAIDGVGWKTFGTGEMPDRIKGAKDIRGAIDQKEPRSIRHNVLLKLKRLTNVKCQSSKSKSSPNVKKKKNFWDFEICHLGFEMGHS